jgi:hypothetical protein
LKRGAGWKEGLVLWLGLVVSCEEKASFSESELESESVSEEEGKDGSKGRMFGEGKGEEMGALVA